MENTVPRYLMIACGAEQIIAAAVFAVLLIGAMLVGFMVYDGWLVNREPTGLSEMRAAVVSDDFE